RRVRVDGDVLRGHLRADGRLPDPRPLQEDVLQRLPALRAGPLGCLNLDALVAQVAAQRDDGDPQAAEVADILAQGEGAVDLVRGLPALLQAGRHETVELRDELVRELRERCTVLLAPPGMQVTVAVELRPLIVETVPDLV